MLSFGLFNCDLVVSSSSKFCKRPFSRVMDDVPPFRFFAGGSERSGQQIVGPPKKKSPNDVVEDLFKGAREHGAVPLERSGKGSGESSKAKVNERNTLNCFSVFRFGYFYVSLSSHVLGLRRRRLQVRSSS